MLVTGGIGDANLDGYGYQGIQHNCFVHAISNDLGKQYHAIMEDVS